MSDDYPESLTPDQKDSSDSIAVDDMGIPILEEIVAPTADHKTETKTPVNPSSEAVKRALTAPNNKILAKALRNQLRSKVKKDLDEITQDVTAKAVSSITQELEQTIKSQLTEILDQNLDRLIDKVMTDITKVK